MKIKTDELEDLALDWAVAKCEGTETAWGKSKLAPYDMYQGHSYSTDWEKSGPIIEREKISLISCDDVLDFSKGYDKPVNRIPVWAAEKGGGHSLNEWHESNWFEPQYEIIASECTRGNTALKAAMRCFVKSKLGNEVDVPDALVSMHQKSAISQKIKP